MALINKAVNEITLKLVYYGPGLCGKTTNLEKIYGDPAVKTKGRMLSMATETDRTLFFDFLPMELGTVGGHKVRVQLYTVPGQVFYDATRKLVLRGADGVVFVADSQHSMRESNLESLANLKENLRLNRLDPDRIALVFQYNKRDLPDIDSVEEMSEYLQPGNVPVIPAVAIRGEGVTETLRAAVGRILANVRANVDVTLYDNAPMSRPSMKAGSGSTQSTAGVPKVSVAGTAPRPEPPRSEPPAPPPPPPPQPPEPPTPPPETFSQRTVEQPVSEPPAEGAIDSQELAELLAAAEEVVTALRRSLATAEAQRDQLRRALDRTNR